MTNWKNRGEATRAGLEPGSGGKGRGVKSMGNEMKKNKITNEKEAYPATMSTEKMIIEPPKPVEKFLEEFTKSGLQVDRSAPVIWLPHPDKKGQWVVAVRVVKSEQTRNTQTSV